MEQDQLKGLREAHQGAVKKYAATGKVPQGFEGDPVFLELVARKVEDADGSSA